MEKMSKSKRNVVDPNGLIDKYGADTVRLFCLFAAPPEKDLDWSEQGVDGAYRFLHRVWRMVFPRLTQLAGAAPYSGGPEDLGGPVRELHRKTHETIFKVTRDIEERFHFNTAVSFIMELVNAIVAFEPHMDAPRAVEVLKAAFETTVVLLSPIVPHFAEELWEALGNGPGIQKIPWPAFREDSLKADEVVIVVQVNGKLRGRFMAESGADSEVLKKKALSDEQVARFVAGRAVKNIIVVPNKLVNIVV
jgi:leucyl-tRNA synthetase